MTALKALPSVQAGHVPDYSSWLMPPPQQSVQSHPLPSYLQSQELVGAPHTSPPPAETPSFPLSTLPHHF